MRILSLVLLLTFFGANSQALETPQDLLKRSQLSSVELQNVIFSLEQNLLKLSDAEMFRSYLQLLPELEARARLSGLDLIYPGAIKELGAKMVAHGMRWLDLRKDSATVLQQHLRWMNGDALYRYLYIAEVQVDDMNEGEARRFCQNIQYLIGYARTQFPNDAYISTGYRDLLSQIAYRELKSLDNNNLPQISFWLPFLQNQETISSYVSTLFERTLVLNEEDEDTGQRLMAIVRALVASLQKTDATLSDAAKESWGQLAVELFDKMLLYGWKFDENAMSATLDQMKLSDLSQLADRWSLPSREPVKINAQTYFTLTERLVDRLESLGAWQKSSDFQEIIEERSVHAAFQMQNLEGTYLLDEPGAGKHWRFTVVRTTNSSYVVGLGQVDGLGQIQSYTRIEYDIDKNSFYATKEVPGKVGLNLFLEFSFADGKMQVRAPLMTNAVLSGEKIESYEDFTNCCGENETAPEGQFIGTATLGENVLPAQLTLINFNGQMIGRLQLDKYVEVDLQEGNSSSRGYVYLTTNSSRGGTEYHIRLKAISPAQLEGYAIVSGHGLKQKFTFQKSAR